MEQVPANSPVAPLISVDPERLGGEPVFRGMRVPVRTLFEYLEAGDTLGTFLDDFEGVTREQALGVLKLAERGRLRQEG